MRTLSINNKTNTLNTEFKIFPKIKRKLKLIVTVVEDGSKESVGQTNQKDHCRQDISLWKKLCYLSDKLKRTYKTVKLKQIEFLRTFIECWMTEINVDQVLTRKTNPISMYLASEKLTGQLEDLFWANSNLQVFLLHLAAYFLILSLAQNLAGYDLTIHNYK